MVQLIVRGCKLWCQASIQLKDQVSLLKYFKCNYGKCNHYGKCNLWQVLLMANVIMTNVIMTKVFIAKVLW